jgi:hypothetical protein
MDRQVQIEKIGASSGWARQVSRFRSAIMNGRKVKYPKVSSPEGLWVICSAFSGGTFRSFRCVSNGADCYALFSLRHFAHRAF